MSRGRMCGTIGKSKGKKKASRKIQKPVRTGYWTKYDALTELQKAVFVILMAILLAYGGVVLTGHSVVGTTETGGVLPSGAYGYNGKMPDGFYEVDPFAASVFSYPLGVLVGRQYLEGKVPLWNDHQGAGMPLAANFESAIFFPFQALQDVLPYYLWSIAYIIRLLFAGIFMYLLLDTVKFDFYGSITGAIFYILSGALILLLRLDPYINVAIMIPALFWAEEKSYRNGNRLSKYHLAMSLFVAMTIAGGQPEMTTLVLVSSVLYLLYKLWIDRALVGWGDRLKILGSFIVAYVIGLLLMMPMLLPGIEYILNSYNTHGNQTGLLHNGNLAYITYVFPYILGQVQQYWANVLHDNFSWDRFSGYLGVVPVFLTLVGLFVRKKRLVQEGILFFAGLGLFLILKTNGFPGINMIGELPLLNKINFFRYSAPLIAFSIAIMVGYAITNLAEIIRVLRTKYFFYYSGVILLVSLIPLAVIISGKNYNLQYLHFSYLYSFLVSLGSLGVLWYMLRVKPLNVSALQRSLMYIVASELLIYIPYGFSDNIILLRAFALLMILVVLVTVAKQDAMLLKKWSIKKEASLIAAFLLVGVVVTVFSEYGPPRTHNDFKLPPFMNSISSDIVSHEYRIYGYGYFRGATSSASGLQDISIMDALVPSDLATYVTTFLDRYDNPVWFDSTVGFRNNSGPTPVDELYRNIKYYDLLGVKYLFANTALSPREMSVINVEPGGIPLSFDPSVVFQESFVSSTNKLDGIGILTATYDRVNRGKIYVYIKEKSSGKVLESRVISASKVVNNGVTRVMFPPIINMKGKELNLQLRYIADGLQPSSVALYYNRNVREAGARLLVNGQGKGGSIGLSQYSSLDQVKEIYNSDGTRIYENDGALPRTFLANSVQGVQSYSNALSVMAKAGFDPAKTAVVEGLLSTLSSPSGTALASIYNYQSDIVSIKARNSRPRLLVLTDTYYPGWIALDNGKETPIYRVDGLFRGIVLPPGVHNVQFVYRPKSFTHGVYLFLFGLLLIGVESVFIIRSREPFDNDI